MIVVLACCEYSVIEMHLRNVSIASNNNFSSRCETNRKSFVFVLLVFHFLHQVVISTILNQRSSVSQLYIYCQCLI